MSITGCTETHGFEGSTETLYWGRQGLRQDIGCCPSQRPTPQGERKKKREVHKPPTGLINLFFFLAVSLIPLPQPRLFGLIC